MLNFLDNLRTKPDRVKKQFAFLVAFLFSGLIFVVWLSILFPSWRSAQIKEDTVSKLEPGPLESLGGIISGGVSSINGEISKAKEKISTFAPSIDTTVVPNE